MQKLFMSLVLSLLSTSAIAAAKPVDYDKLYSACTKKAGTMNNAVVYECSDEVSTKAKAEMNQLYDKIYNQLKTDNAEDAKKFESSQRAWLTYRNSHCELAGSHVGSPMYSYCPMTLNIARVKELRELAGE